MSDKTNNPDFGQPVESEATEVVKNEDGSVTVSLAPPPEDMPEEAYNLVPHFQGTEEGRKFLKTLSETVIDDFDADWESCEAYRKKRKELFKLLTGNLDPKSYPFEDCANVHVPVMLKSVLRIVHRLYAEMFPDNDYIFAALPSSRLSQERADILTLHGNWQLRKEIDDFLRQNRRGLMEFIITGDVIFYSSRDIPGARNRHEALNCEEVVIPYHWKSTRVDMSDIPRKTRILRKYKHELRNLEQSGVFSNIDIVFEREKHPDFVDDTDDLVVRGEVDKADGREPPISGAEGDDSYPVAPYKLLEHHCWTRLPGSDYEVPTVVTVERKTRTVVGLFVREEEDWKDRVRFESQSRQLEEFRDATSDFQQLEQQEAQLRGRLMQPDVPFDERAQLEKALTQTKPPAPVPPTWLGDTGQPKPVRKVPIEYFSHGVCIENIDGSMGLGIGGLLAEFNKMANTFGSQFSDAATLSNLATMIMPESIKMEPGDMRLSPGEIHRVRGVSPDQVQNAFKVIQFPPANPQLIDMLRLALEGAEDVSSAPDVLSGEAGKSNETYRGIATRVEQATKQLTVLATNYLEMLANVLKNNARLNAVFLDEEEIKHVVDPQTLESREIKLGRALYAEDFDIAFTADTRFAGKQQRIAEADQLVGMIQALPPPLAMQMFPPSFVYEAVVRALKARGLHDMIRYLGPRPPEGMPMMPPQPPGMAPGMPPQGGPPIQGPPAPPPQ